MQEFQVAISHIPATDQKWWLRENLLFLFEKTAQNTSHTGGNSVSSFS